ncbi:heavy metal translocating P-type ATPase, partial [Candidatus Marithioploca araucensis]|nr:heavy metal translocating P-type ATPase [Candidatus Marithioploca araucensis]
IIPGYLIYPPLLLIGIFPLLYITLCRFKSAYTALFIDKRLRIDVVDSLWLTVALAKGYYFWVALGLSFYFFSEKILAETEDSSRKNLINIFAEQPRSVWILINGIEIEKSFEQLQVGDIIVVHASEIIPVDGIIRKGIASIDQHRLTGEAQPAEKIVGDSVFASTLVQSGKLHIQVEKTGQETVVAQIGKILSKMSNFTLSIQIRGKELTDKSTLPTLVLSSIALPLVGSNGALALLGNYPGANLRLIAPMTLLNFLKVASQHGILIKDGRSLELMSKIDTIVFDKTGTLTLEQPKVCKVHLCNLLSESELLSYAATAEYRQTHPVAQAILAVAIERQLLLQIPQQAHYEVGYGIKVQLPNKLLCVGSDRFMQMEGISIPEHIQAIHKHCHELGNSLIMVAIDDELAGAIELEAKLRPETKKVIKQLQQRGLALYIISGDQEGPTRKLANQLGIQNYFANTLPEKKAQLIEKLQQDGKNICFVGDGINDSIALTQADVSVSLSGASTIATDTAQIVLMDANLERLIDLLQITQALDENMKTNIIFSVIPGVLGIGSVFLFHLGFMTSVVLSMLGLFTGVTNTMRPIRLFHHMNSENSGDTIAASQGSR